MQSVYTLIDHRNIVKMIIQNLIQVQRFEHFEVISKVDKSKDHGKFLSICILRYHWQFLTSTFVEIYRKIALSCVLLSTTKLSTNRLARNHSVIAKNRPLSMTRSRESYVRNWLLSLILIIIQKNLLTCDRPYLKLI